MISSSQKLVYMGTLQAVLMIATTTAYSQSQADLQVGAQSWNESGWYADNGYKSGYSGYFCLCECYANPEGIFCQGGGIRTDKSVVANFLGVFAQDGPDATWTGDLVAYQTNSSQTVSINIDNDPISSLDHQRLDGNMISYESGKPPPFHDHFKFQALGGPANYTGVSQAAGQESFVWRGYMSGVTCSAKSYCNDFCNTSTQYQKWVKSC